ncbi:unnamed protein product [Moneuplotes crassus]|uniref:Uncharacterized protein n=1 Tax=Euplotes crassus TaxID=5936 RepID=A0AAD1XL46_EUPCR|nr:unnamed protein product [Moneuplotes crassus]
MNIFKIKRHYCIGDALSVNLSETVNIPQSWDLVEQTSITAVTVNFSTIDCGLKTTFDLKLDISVKNNTPDVIILQRSFDHSSPV